MNVWQQVADGLAIKAAEGVPPAYVYDMRVGRYRDAQTGRFVSFRTVLELVDLNGEASADVLYRLSMALGRGELPFSAWYLAARQTITRLHVQNAALGAGGFERLRPADFRRIDRMLDEDGDRLARFGQQIVDGALSEAQIANRARMYAGHARIHYFKSMPPPRVGKGEVVLERRQMHPVADHCSYCVHLEGLGWQPYGTLPVPGESDPTWLGDQCLSACKCSLIRKTFSAAEARLMLNRTGKALTLPAMASLFFRAFDEDKVRRWPKGTPVDEATGAGGGRFAPKEGGEDAGELSADSGDDSGDSGDTLPQIKPDLSRTLTDQQLDEMSSIDILAESPSLEMLAQYAQKRDMAFLPQEWADAIRTSLRAEGVPERWHNDFRVAVARIAASPHVNYLIGNLEMGRLMAQEFTDHASLHALKRLADDPDRAWYMWLRMAQSYDWHPAAVQEAKDRGGAGTVGDVFKYVERNYPDLMRAVKQWGSSNVGAMEDRLRDLGLEAGLRLSAVDMLRYGTKHGGQPDYRQLIAALREDGISDYAGIAAVYAEAGAGKPNSYAVVDAIVDTFKDVPDSDRVALFRESVTIPAEHYDEMRDWLGRVTLSDLAAAETVPYNKTVFLNYELAVAALRNTEGVETLDDLLETLDKQAAANGVWPVYRSFSQEVWDKVLDEMGATYLDALGPATERKIDPTGDWWYRQGRKLDFDTFLDHTLAERAAEMRGMSVTNLEQLLNGILDQDIEITPGQAVRLVDALRIEPTEYFVPQLLALTREFQKTSADSVTGEEMDVPDPEPVADLWQVHQGPRDESLNDEAAQKDALAQTLSAAAGVDYNVADQFVRQWAHTSNDADMRSLGIQEAASREFGVELSAWQRQKIEEVMAGYDFLAKQRPLEDILPRDQARAATTALLHAMYENTQKWLEPLKEDGITHVRLYRGTRMHVDEIGDARAGDVIAYDDNVLSSWSLSYEIAQQFRGTASGEKASVVVSALVPLEKVFASARSGFGCLNEDEFVVLGNGEGDGYARIESVHLPEPDIEEGEGTDFDPDDDMYKV